ncbi:hypothetical protein K488DRAFT_83088 [Vararia minispora EC-137]|uniref:Uncharacterized protein n=1 Tax=Vararia minispora EC-137 TaxID=1314806 RepID=A0ACB8QUD7_9AGAM|nr:hypothetical protein K488DRAFT_83088 [Vararia minispora EC-137]
MAKTTPARVCPQLRQQLPLELLEDIGRHCDSRNDLIALAQTCVSLRNVIIPNHLDYRVIRAPFAHKELWQHLIDHPGLAGNVYTLILYDGIPSFGWRIPRAVENSACNGSAVAADLQPTLFIAALKAMVNVRSLKLDSICPGGLPAFHIALEVLRWATTLLPSLSELTISLRAPVVVFPGSIAGDEALLSARQQMADHSMWALRRLTKIDFEEHECIYYDQVVGNSLGPMLSASVFLQEIKIAAVPTPLASIFFNVRLPALRALYITRQHHMSSMIEELFVHFLRAHPTIDTLQLTMQTPNRWGTPVPPPHPLLPNIRHLLDAPGALMMPIFNCRVDRSLRLSTLGDFHMLAAASTTAFCAINRDTLRKLGLAYMINLSTLRLAASIFPALEELTLPRAGDPMVAMKPVQHSTCFPEWYTRLYAADDVVPAFPRLCVVSNVRAETGFIPDYREWLKEGSADRSVIGRVEREEVERALRALRAKYPRLRVVNGWRLDDL